MAPLVHVDPQGFAWRPFAVEYQSDDRTFGVVIYALSIEHARLVLDDLKETATVSGEIIGLIGEGDA